MWSVKKGTPKIIVNLLFTSVPKCTGSNTKILGLKHLQFPAMGVSGGPPDGACVVHQRSDELLAQQNSIADGQTTSLVWRGPSIYSLCAAFFLTWLICADQVSCVSGSPQDNGRYWPIGLALTRYAVYQGHPKITVGTDPLDWLPEELKWSGFQDAPISLNEKEGRDLQDIDGDPPFSQPPL